jgi:hypothetical protein
MEQNKIPTAGELMSKYGMDIPPFGTTKKLMIEFAKLHVKAALEAAVEKGKVEGVWKTEGGDPKVLGSYRQVFQGYEINKESILNVYPENLIQ